MKPRLSVLALCVDDLERSLRFYRDGLGLQTPGIIGQEFEHGAVAFFDLQPGMRLAIWPRRAWPTTRGSPWAVRAPPSSRSATTSPRPRMSTR